MPSRLPIRRADAALEELRAQVEYHARRYHQDDDPEIADAEYDALVASLRALEAEHPELVDRRLADRRRRAPPASWASEQVRPSRCG